MERKEFEALVRDALDRLPKVFQEKLENIDFIVEEEPDMETVRALGLGAKGRLLGLYQGVPLKKRTHYYGMVMPDKITLYKANIERSCRSREEVRAQLQHVIEHEIAHHFGITDQRLRDMGTY
jgi:predicted Zn-dependent protease with MMP-like domain